MHRTTLSNHRKLRGGILLGMLAVSLSAAGRASASPVISWSINQLISGHRYSANAQVVNNNNNTWSILLQATTGGNAAQSNASSNPHVLTGFLWQDTFAGAYAKLAAAANSGSGIFNDNGSAYGGSDTVAQNWGYTNNLGFGLFNQGVGASGLSGLFGASSPFSGNGGLGGVDWGIVSGFDPAGIGGQQNPFIKDTGIFTFGGQVTASQFGAVRFQYGSSPTEPGFEILPPTGGLVPEIGGVYQMLAAGLPLVGLGIARRRRRAG
jgi:hypothetical protein